MQTTTDTSPPDINNTTDEVGTFHRSRFTGTPWFTPDGGERDELGRVIPTMVDEDMDLSPLDA